eukprot:TRINITY_DN13216_c0_g1_i1.p1 TRINITY_DN13216_c0_g1~~TRINITY_DN13216_c0_g1_i1.p1  ORF type:complete len:114 (-),score=42.07 TRINITY_DN13216_c0_g1_i1:32-322(-)
MHLLQRRLFRSSSFLWERKLGSVKWFDQRKGYGFLTPQDGSAEVFVHHSAVQMEGFRTLAGIETVEFDVESDANGRLHAANVTGPDGAALPPRERR